MTRWIAPASAVLGSLLLCGCSAVVQPGPACRPLETAELPRLGLLRGAWLDDERFVLADLHRSRLLVYGTAEGLVRSVNGLESADPALAFVSPMDIKPWGRGYLLADGYPNQDRFLELDSKLRPVGVLWESDVESTTGVSSGRQRRALSDHHRRRGIRHHAIGRCARQDLCRGQSDGCRTALGATALGRGVRSIRGGFAAGCAARRAAGGRCLARLSGRACVVRIGFRPCGYGRSSRFDLRSPFLIRWPLHTGTRRSGPAVGGLSGPAGAVAGVASRRWARLGWMGASGGVQLSCRSLR